MFFYTKFVPSIWKTLTSAVAVPLVVVFFGSATAHASVVSDTHPNEDAWYSSRNISLSWDVPSEAVAASTLYDASPASIPTRVYTPPIREKSFIADADGVHYFHLQFKTESGWGDVIHYKLQLDTEPPEKVSVSFPDNYVTASPQPDILVVARDKTSGVKDILISVDDKATTTHPYIASNLYKLPKEAPGKHVATITVKDHAGNISSAVVEYFILTIDPPKITEYTRFAEKGDVLRISGKTYPSSSVQIVYTNIKTNESILAGTESKENGIFLHTQTRGLPEGIYEMKARVIDAQGAESEFSSSHVIGIESATSTKIGMLLLNWLSLALILIVTGTLIAATLWYSVLQFARFRRKVARITQEAEYALKMNVAALRRDTEEFYSLLKKTEKKRELTKEEQSILKKFKKRLDSTEKEIEKKLEQIG